MTRKARLYLDIDGVLNALPGHKGLKKLSVPRGHGVTIELRSGVR